MVEPNVYCRKALWTDEIKTELSRLKSCHIYSQTFARKLLMATKSVKLRRKRTLNQILVGYMYMFEPVYILLRKFKVNSNFNTKFFIFFLKLLKIFVVQSFNSSEKS